MKPSRSAPIEARVAQGPRPTFRMLNSNRQAGFTLIEVTAVMLIIALVASLVVSMTQGTGRPRLKALALEAAALLRRERVNAILTGHDRQVSLDGARRVLVGENGDIVMIPHDVVFDILGANEVRSGHLAIVRFRPDGASSGAVLRLSREGTAYEIRVNWYTGGVTID
jgi:general secretion pathway protein H